MDMLGIKAASSACEEFIALSFDASQKKLIKLALQNIVSSSGFTNSTQLSNFLTFIITKTLDDKTQEIKGYTIGVDALGRPEDFDPQIDPSVRVMAGRLRQSLENYNRNTGGFTHEGTNVQIELVKGSYVPKINFSNEQRKTNLRIKTGWQRLKKRILISGWTL